MIILILQRKKNNIWDKTWSLPEDEILERNTQAQEWAVRQGIIEDYFLHDLEDGFSARRIN